MPYSRLSSTEAVAALPVLAQIGKEERAGVADNQLAGLAAAIDEDADLPLNLERGFGQGAREFRGDDDVGGGLARGEAFEAAQRLGPQPVDVAFYANGQSSAKRTPGRPLFARPRPMIGR